ncbi:hypothetical protein B0F90DRAFT_450080 [Multifurca ochricompacta]|uniref:Poly(A) RNA polymerase mitochondrial-like central palm domain-containing protein n=1 Tax=Multifurca ochricompacta TaxID=376703 RepID=A0AAD4M2U4_9AGAM|nr:hypothetical protein B0F90DRAFT_450080 [Multifurca ochricompacta]
MVCIPKVSSFTDRCELRNFDETSQPWSRHQLIVPDPFVMTHNHTFNVQRSTLHYLSMLAETCVSLLRNARPLHTVFGPYYKPEVFSEQRCRSRSPSPFRSEIIRPPAGNSMERRRCFSANPRMREELMKMYHTNAPGQLVREMRQRTVAKVASAIQNNFGAKYHVEVFGSTQYGVDGQTSDLDLVVIVGEFFSLLLLCSERVLQDPDRMTGFTPDVDLSSLPRIYKISEVSAILQRLASRFSKRSPRQLCL